MTNLDVVNMWYKGKENFERANINLYIKDFVLYSYGRHYPLARFYNGYVLINSNKSSVSTNRQKRLVKQIAGDYVEMPYIIWDDMVWDGMVWEKQKKLKENIEYLEKHYPQEDFLINELKQQYILKEVKNDKLIL